MVPVVSTEKKGTAKVKENTTFGIFRQEMSFCYNKSRDERESKLRIWDDKR